MTESPGSRSAGLSGTRPGGITAVVPVKEELAKQRLAGLLTEQERIRLAASMLDDVIEALRQSSLLARVVMVTRDQPPLPASLPPGVEILPEPAGLGGLNDAVQFAAARRAEAGDEGVLIVPLDVPLVTARDVDTILATAPPAPSVALVAARDGDGTNALLTKPPNLLTYQYGPGSFRAHLTTAIGRRIATAVLELPNLALDIDRPEDLTALMAHPGDTRTQAFLRSLGLGQRHHGRNRVRESDSALGTRDSGSGGLSADHEES